MSEITPVHSTEYGTSDENKELFNKLDQAREQGKLAEARELAAEGVTEEELKLDFDMKSDEELAKMKKDELLAYMKEFSANADRYAEAKAEHAAKLAERAAIHGIPRGKLGEPIQAMLEVRPDHPGRGKPYPLFGEDGEPRMTQGKRGRKPSPITRIDN